MSRAGPSALYARFQSVAAAHGRNSAAAAVAWADWQESLPRAERVILYAGNPEGACGRGPGAGASGGQVATDGEENGEGNRGEGAGG